MNRRILFVSNDYSEGVQLANQSLRYRVLYPSFALRKLGYFSSVTTILNLTKLIDFNYDIYIFHSPIISTGIKRAYQKLLKKNKILVADFDDFIVDVGKYELTFYNSHHSAKNSKTYALEKVLNHIEALNYFKTITCSTKQLQRNLLGLFPNKNIYFLPFFIPNFFQGQFNKMSPTHKTNSIVFGYGSSSNTNSFLKVTDEIARLAVNKKDLNILVIGNLKTSNNMLTKDLIRPNIIFLPRMEYSRYLRTLSQSKLFVNFVDLDEVTLCKARTKLLESSAVGVPVLSSNIPDYIDANNNGLKVSFIDNDPLDEKIIDVFKNIISQSNCKKNLKNSHGDDFFVNSFSRIVDKL